MKRTLLSLAVGAVLAGCSSTTNVAPVPTPNIYGENGFCYYWSDPAEVAALQQAGLCPIGWVGAPAPTPWRLRWADVYDSPSYVQYVPVAQRAVYRKTVHTYVVKHDTEIQHVRVKYRTVTTTPSQDGWRRDGDRPTRRPTFGSDRGRPTVTSGPSSRRPTFGSDRGPARRTR